MKTLIETIRRSHSEWMNFYQREDGIEDNYIMYMFYSIKSLYVKPQYDENYEPDLNPGGGPYHIES